MARGVLNRDWAVTNKQGVAETVDYLIAEKNNVGGNMPKLTSRVLEWRAV